MSGCVSKGFIYARSQHNGSPPKTYAEKNEFKKSILAMKKKVDEENFDEAVAQAYRAWTETKVPFEINELFSDPGLSILGPSSSPFFHMLAALKTFTEQPPYTLPLTSTLPDMKADTSNYIHLQKLYKSRAEEEKTQFAAIVKSQGVEASPAMVDEFVRNAHGLKIVHGKSWGSFDENRAELGELVLSTEAYWLTLL